MLRAMAMFPAEHNKGDAGSDEAQCRSVPGLWNTLGTLQRYSPPARYHLFRQQCQQIWPHPDFSALRRLKGLLEGPEEFPKLYLESLINLMPASYKAVTEANGMQTSYGFSSLD